MDDCSSLQNGWAVRAELRFSFLAVMTALPFVCCRVEVKYKSGFVKMPDKNHLRNHLD